MNRRRFLPLVFVLTLLCGVGSTFADLVSYWPLNHDLLDVAKTGAIQDIGRMEGQESYVEGPFGPCLDLDGSSHVWFPTSIDLKLTGDLSVSLWCRVSRWDKPHQCLLAGGLEEQFHLQRFAESNQALAFGGGSGTISGGDINDGQWHHVLAVSQVDVGKRLFIDGIQVAVDDKPDLMRSLTVMLGANPLKAGREWQGQIDDAGVFSRALNRYEAAAIVKLAQKPDFRYTLGQVNDLFEAHRNQSQVTINNALWTYTERIELADGATVPLGNGRSGMRLDTWPHIESFTASNVIPVAGERVTLTWDVTKAESLTLEPGGADLPTNALNTGSFVVSPREKTVFTLTASNAQGTDSAEITIHAGVDMPELQLSEWMAAPAGETTDENGDKSDWIEIHNPGPIALPLQHYFLTDTPNQLRKWALPHLDLEPGAYRIVYASGKNQVDEKGDWHTNFKLDQDGEYLALTHGHPGHLEIRESMRFPRQQRGISYGRSGGSSFGYLVKPTPGAANVGVPYDTLTDRVVFSHERGFCETAFELELQCDDGAIIRYTVDGSTPTPGSGFLYDQERIPISRTTTVRALAYGETAAPSPIETHTFLFTKDFLRQEAQPPGFPVSWSTIPADYEMDPDIVESIRFRDRVLEGLHALPTVSLTLEMDDLFGVHGIYANPLEIGRAWERACSLEMIHPTGRAFQIDCGLRMHGGHGRMPDFMKHNFRVLFKRDYGPSRLDSPLFPDAGATKSFDTLILRAGFNNSWHRQSIEEEPRAQYLRDEFMRRTQRAMGHSSGHGTFVHLVLNGLYWGIYNLVERPNADFAAAYYGGKKSEWDALNSGKVVDGDDTAWKKVHELAREGIETQAAYEQIKQWLDVTNLIDYMILNFYGCNQDWDTHNWYAARRRQPGEGFKFFSWDAERTLESLTQDRISWDSGPVPSGLHGALMKNADYRIAFADQIHKHCTGDGALTPDRVVARYRRLAQEIESAIVCESARWGDVSNPDGPYTLDDWEAERSRLLESYLPRRTAIVMRQFSRKGLYPRVRPPSLRSRASEPGEIVLELEGGQVWFTTDGSDPRSPGGAINPGARSVKTVRIQSGEVIKARVLQAGIWSALAETRID